VCVKGWYGLVLFINGDPSHHVYVGAAPLQRHPTVLNSQPGRALKSWRNEPGLKAGVRIEGQRALVKGRGGGYFRAHPKNRFINTNTTGSS
jgi:hypothetical protein